MCHVSLGRVGGSKPHVTHDVIHDTLPCSETHDVTHDTLPCSEFASFIFPI